MTIIEQSWMLVAEMFEAIGPGFVLALALPVFLAALVLLVRAGAKRAAE